MSAPGASAGIWRYAQRLPPVPPEHRVTLGEGGTPLIAAPRLAAAIGIRTLYLKLEAANPTGSFKDRGTALAVSAALAAGAHTLVEDSSGNAGASAAAYAARAGLRCTVYAPASAPAAKLRQAEAYGATVVAMPGSRSAVADAARHAARDRRVFHLDHNSSALFAAGTGTLALELAEALPELPAFVTPTGGGSTVAGAFAAFSGLAGDGTIAACPPIFAVQPDACAPLVRALDAGWDSVPPIEAQPTIAGGISIADPPRGAELLTALRGSRGGAVAVFDEAIRRWGTLLARLEGVYAEPTAAAAVAGLARLVAAQRISPDGAAIAIITGSGLKDPENSGR